ncbi:MAG: O-methyltransferase [Gemmatimonadales bacterium]
MDEPARLERYVTELFAAEDPVLSRIRARHDAEKLPTINISPEEGKLLHVLLRIIDAQRVLEIGSLGGYSGVWLARALPPTGKLTTIEKDPRHARIARESFATAGLQRQVELIEGGALEVLPTLAPGFDAVFIDADKEPLPAYFDWGMKLLRRGGLLLCDNAFFHGAAIDPSDRSPSALGVRAFNQLAAQDPRLVATIIPVRDGLLIGLKTRDGP